MQNTNSFFKRLIDGCDVRVMRYYSQHFTSFYMDIHYHDAAEIMYVLSGKCMIEYMDDIKGELVKYELKQGNFVFFDSNVPHSMNIRDNECKLLCIEMTTVLNDESKLEATRDEIFHINGGIKNHDAVRNLAKKSPSHMLLKDVSKVYDAVKGVQRELNLVGMAKESAEIRNMMVGIKFTELVIEIARSYAVATTGSEAISTYVKKAVKFINANFDTEFRVEDIAIECNIHENYLQRIFKEIQGEAIIKYINRLRMEKAELLLLDTDMSIVDIAENVGYNSRQHFGHVFKEFNGMSPKQYRAMGGYRGEIKLLTEDIID